jgi:ribosomal protein S12 methylthiotransferase accessory factor
MFEREFSITESENKILETLNSLSLAPAIKFNSTHTVATCTLENSEGMTVSEAAGKGRYCYVGAMAESLEHYTLEYLSSDNISTCSTNDIRNQALTHMDGLLANLPEGGTSLECVTVTDIQNGRTALIPSALHLPHKHIFNTRNTQPAISFLNRYSTNSGIAFGCSEHEAILHGLNEVLERHMYSKILMSLCGQYEPLMLKSPTTAIIDEIFEDHSELRLIARGMKVLMTETLPGVYFCMAIPKRPNGRFVVCPVGSGSSLDPRVSIERAVTELSQAMELYDDGEKETDKCAHSLIERSSALRPLIRLETLRNIESTFRRLDPPRTLSVAEQIDLITDNLSVTGSRAFTRTIANFASGCAVTQTYVPGLERFNLIRAGIPVVPQRLLHANRALE